MMWGQAVKMMHRIREEMRDNPAAAPDGSAPVEMNAWANRVTLDVIGKAGLGANFDALTNSNDPLIRVYSIILEPTSEKVTFFAAHALFPPAIVNRLPWKLEKILTEHTASLRNICLQQVRLQREAVKTKGDHNVDLLSNLIRLDQFSDDQLVNQMLTFLAAGHETTSSTFSWVAYLLALHPDVQTRVRDEVQAQRDILIAGRSDIIEVLEKMPWLNGVVNETLRLFPTVPLTMRECVRETTLLDIPIAVGTEFLLSPWATNRNPELWGPDADMFRPERWIDAGEAGQPGRPNNTGGSKSNYSLLTFLHGPRSCIGQSFSKAELRCLLAACVLSFKWTLNLAGGAAVPGGVITTKPSTGMHLVMTPLEDLPYSETD